MSETGPKIALFTDLFKLVPEPVLEHEFLGQTVYESDEGYIQPIIDDATEAYEKELAMYEEYMSDVVPARLYVDGEPRLCEDCRDESAVVVFCPNTGDIDDEDSMMKTENYLWCGKCLRKQFNSHPEYVAGLDWYSRSDDRLAIVAIRGLEVFLGDDATCYYEGCSVSTLPEDERHHIIDYDDEISACCDTCYKSNKDVASHPECYRVLGLKRPAIYDSPEVSVFYT